MTREEWINDTAVEYGKQVSSDYIRSKTSAYDFAQGIKYADKHTDVSSLWHDAKEMPKYGSAYIAIDNNNNICDCCDESLIISQTVWADIVSVRNIKKWIYVADILPKGGIYER